MSDRNLHVLQVTSAFLPTIAGAELVVHNLSEGLIDAGHTVTVVTKMKPGPKWQHRYGLEYLKFQYPLIAGSLIGRVMRRKQFESIVKRLAPDVVHVHFAYPYAFELAQSRDKIACPIVLTCHGEDIQKDPSIPYGMRLNPRIEKRIQWSVRNVDANLAISSDVAAELRSLQVPENRIRSVQNPIGDVNELVDPMQARRRIGLSTDASIILALGRNHPKKGFADLLKMLPPVCEAEPATVCLFVGRGTEKLAPIVSELGLQKHVRLLGETLPAGLVFETENPGVRTTLDYFAAADVYAMCSRTESFGLVTIEAMAAGLPVVAFSSPGSKDLIVNGNNGIICPRGDFNAYSDALIEILSSPEKRRPMGVAAKQFATRFQRQVVAQDHAKLYCELL